MHTLDKRPDNPSEGRDDWRQDAERWICRINGVRQCKIDLDDAGEITGVHVVAIIGRDARHIVRDVEGLFKARLGIPINYKKIGVVQVVENEPAEQRAEPDSPPAAPAERPVEGGARILDLDRGAGAMVVEEAAAPRIRCLGVGVTTTDATITAEVELAAGAVNARGRVSGPNHTGGDIQLIARAAVDAVSRLVADPVVLSLTEVRESSVGGQKVLLAAVEMVEGRHSDRLFGTCSLSQNPQQATVFAVLDALNRRLSLMAFKEVTA